MSAAIVSLLQLAQGLAQYSWHFANARKELREIGQTLDGVLLVLRSLDERIDEAGGTPCHPWYRGLRRLDPKTHRDGPIVRLRRTMEELVGEVMPDKDWKKRSQPLIWHWSRDKISNKLRDIESCRAAISQVLDKDQFDISLKIQEQGDETNENIKQVQLQGQDTNAAMLQMHELMRTFKTGQQKQLEFQQKQEEEIGRETRDKIAEWLSPFQFLARQQELFEGSYPTGRWLLSGDEFKSWYRGRPCKPKSIHRHVLSLSREAFSTNVRLIGQLQLWGDAGAGKVCVKLECLAETFRLTSR